MTNPENARRWHDVTIADLIFFEKLGSTISGGAGDSMLAVASAAGLSYPHLHNTLGKLESIERFGRRLVNRELIALTKEGEEVLAYARRVLDVYRVRPFKSSRVTLRIAATNRILTTLLASYFPAFMENYRKKTGLELNIEILEATFEQLLTWLEVGEVELAFGGASTHKHEKLMHVAIRDDLKMIVVAPPKGIGVFSRRAQKEGYRPTVRDFASTNFCLIRRDQRGTFRNLPEPKEGYSRIVVDNYSSVVAMVRAEAAVGLVINYGVPGDLLKFDLADASQSAQSFAIWRRIGSPLSDAAQHLYDCVGASKKRAKAKK
jgi:DNA-binding transcriptional LysR family regulator